jgi:hypothetical protein
MFIELIWVLLLMDKRRLRKLEAFKIVLDRNMFVGLIYR